jgi:hypothetical protein
MPSLGTHYLLKMYESVTRDADSLATCDCRYTTGYLPSHSMQTIAAIPPESAVVEGEIPVATR